MSSDEQRVIRGHAQWHETIGGRSVELLSSNEIEIHGDASRWAVASPTDPGDQIWVDSVSREVRRFLHEVLAEMHRIARRSTVRPAPKPTPKPQRRLPAHAPVPCPLCGGEGWVDCHLCDGEGVISQQRSAEWAERNR